MTDYLDISGVAQILGVAPDTVRRYKATDPSFPPPDITLGQSPGWQAATIRQWAGRRPGQGSGGGRPAKTGPILYLRDRGMRGAGDRIMDALADEGVEFTRSERTAWRGAKVGRRVVEVRFASDGEGVTVQALRRDGDMLLAAGPLRTPTMPRRFDPDATNSLGGRGASVLDVGPIVAHVKDVLRG